MFVAPMRLDTLKRLLDDNQYMYEPEIEGKRVILTRTGIETRLFFHKNNEVTRFYPELHQVPVNGDVTLDGVLTHIVPETGCYDKSIVLERLRCGSRKQIEAAVRYRPVTFVIFDIIYFKGRDLRNLSLMKRKSVLQSVLKENRYFRRISNVQDRTGNVVAKRKDSKYVGRRSHDWILLTNDGTVETIK